MTGQQSRHTVHSPPAGGEAVGVRAEAEAARARPSVDTSPLTAALRRAAAAVESEPSAIEPGTRPDELHEVVTILCDAVRRALHGEEPAVGRASVSVPSHRVLQLLRRALLGELSDLELAIDALTIVRMLEAFEGVQQALEREDAHRFVNRLAGAGGLELLIEVAHDLRSPLASILFLAETLRKGQSGAVTPVQERQLGLVYSAAFGLSAMASDVIELARGGDRLLDVRPVPFSVSDIMRSVRDIVLPMAEEKGLSITLTPPEADFRVGHPGALNRVLLNLTTNALKFTNDGYVEVAAKQLSRTRIEFSVRDTGRGIPPEVLANLFETFRPRRTPGEYSFSSAGLGLAICRKLIAGMGGELKVETAPNFGTRFSFELDLPIAARL